MATVSWIAIVGSRVKMAPLIPGTCEEPPQILLLLLFCLPFIDGRGKAYPKGKLRPPWKQFQMILSGQSVHGMDRGNQAVGSSCQVDEELKCFPYKVSYPCWRDAARPCTQSLMVRASKVNWRAQSFTLSSSKSRQEWLLISLQPETDTGKVEAVLPGKCGHFLTFVFISLSGWLIFVY